jgi:hypothetical protein
MSGNRPDGEFEPLEGPLDEAVRAVLAATVPAEAVMRVRERAEALDRRVPPLKRARYARYLAGGLAAAAAVLAMLWMLGSHDAWAQVAETMRGKDWVRMMLKVPPGVEIPGGGGPPETWFSARHRRCAHSFQKRLAFVDLARQETWEYDPAKGTILLTSTRESRASEVGFLGLLMALVVPDAAAHELPPTSFAILNRERREVVEGDKRWIDFSFTCRDPRRVPQPHEWRVTLRVDPNTNLPFEMISTEKMGPNDAAREWTYVLDYPASGPADIYALGAPRTAQVDDRRRKPGETAGLKELFAAYDRAWKQPIEPYTATVMLTTADKRDVHFAYRVEHGAEGSRVWQVDIEQLLAVRQQVWDKKLVVPADAEAWWSEQVWKMKFGEPYKNEFLVPHEANYPKMTGGIFASTEFHTPNLDGDSVTVSLDKQPTIGPGGTVLVRVVVESGASFNDAAYWIAPDRDYQVLRSELRYKREREDWDIRVQTVDELAQSPSGRWYATQTRLGQVRESGDELPGPKEGGPVSTSVYRYLVEFK